MRICQETGPAGRNRTWSEQRGRLMKARVMEEWDDEGDERAKESKVLVKGKRRDENREGGMGGCGGDKNICSTYNCFFCHKYLSLLFYLYLHSHSFLSLFSLLLLSFFSSFSYPSSTSSY